MTSTPTARTVTLGPDTIDEAVAWLAEHGAAAHLDGPYLRVIDGNAVEGYAMVTVPFGDGLTRDDDSMWRRVRSADVLPADPATLDPDAARALALSLLERADQTERAPRRPGGPRRHRGRPIMARALHDVWCGWRIATRDDERPELAWCAGCGLAVEIGAPAGAGA